ncbi:UDP-N-acetylenolpyruvoylglucosamine reductase domain protein [Corynebacterium efficiens YS-314]|uniref:UDP-N-acetylmuramate dehydrogenase n=1 Tax=Corynebacterium efficiens TaxID=152794 RepID=UPI00016088D2|nr:UDP-N-acetylmuramate dehydrogenase [Corynebacterium efficiens]EEW48448.1 UDP-N-acetylenolpyruvoylglucosamine reductase domain protein [Corynebacterium efficiens YS-314]
MLDSSLTQEIAVVDGAELDPDVTFADLTTLHIGGKPRLAVRCATTDAVAQVVRMLDDASVPLLVVGGGSNLVVADGELDVVAVIIEADDVTLNLANGVVVAEAGAEWDDVVSLSVDAGLGGIECLSGIPGSAGATPVQNVGAYGVEISDVLTRVQLLDRGTGEVSWVDASSLELAYRYSNLKFTNRAVVLAIELQLRDDGLSAPLRFGELARRLAVSEQENAAGTVRRPVALVREAVLELRRAKGMVVETTDHDTWSAGSFFTNPIVDPALADQVQARVAAERGEEEAARMPRYPAGEGKEKLSAAWLIERAGFAKGHPGSGARAGLSTKHTLALTNRGDATSEDLVALAREIRDGVYAVFGVRLVPEPVWVGVEID